jgi:hypothetical protein
MKPTRPPEKLDMQTVDVQSTLPFQFLTSLLRVRRGWFANHVPQRTRRARYGCNGFARAPLAQPYGPSPFGRIPFAFFQKAQVLPPLRRWNNSLAAPLSGCRVAELKLPGMK